MKEKIEKEYRKLELNANTLCECGETSEFFGKNDEKRERETMPPTHKIE